MESENENNFESDIESETDTDLENEITNQLEIEIANQLENDIGSVLNNYLQNHNQPQQINNYTTFNNYLSERNHFENELYDHLVGSVSFNGINFVYIHGISYDTNENSVNENYTNAVNDDFWDPVVVSYDKVELLENIDEQGNCSICTEEQPSFKRLKCCNQKLCVGCCEEWFARSVKCPYCHQDLRDFDN
jgi:hypothetical protein